MIEEKTILYVEDDPMSREALKVILERVMGVKRLHIFEDSVNFMGRVAALPARPDIILLDIHVKPHDGFEMLKMLRQDPVFSEAIVIALTASVMNEQVAMLKSHGFDGVFGKPINVAKFPSLLKRAASGESIWHVTDQ